MSNNQRLVTAMSGGLVSPGDLRGLGGTSLGEQAKQILEAVQQNRRKDGGFYLKVKATVAADDKNVSFFNALELSTSITSAAGVTFSTNCPAGYSKLLQALRKETLFVRGLTITVSDEALWQKNWWLTDGDFIKQTSEEFNSQLEAAKQQITDDPKTRIVPVDFALDGYTGIFIEDLDTGATVQISAYVVAIPTRIR